MQNCVELKVEKGTYAESVSLSLSVYEYSSKQIHEQQRKKNIHFHFKGMTTLKLIYIYDFGSVSQLASSFVPRKTFTPTVCDYSHWRFDTNLSSLAA